MLDELLERFEQTFPLSAMARALLEASISQGPDDQHLSGSHRAALMVRAPRTGFVIRKEFSGAPLDPGELHDMDDAREKWPDDESLCDIAWDGLEKHFSMPAVPPRG